MSAEGSYIEPIRGLGTTWYARGAAYWWRRVGFTVLFLFLALFGAAFSALVLWSGFWHNVGVPLPVQIGATVVGAGTTAWAAVVTERAARRTAQGQLKRNRRSIAGLATGLIGLARLTVFGLVVLALSYFITLGVMSVLFVRSLGREFGEEHAARLRDQKRRERHGNPAPLDRKHRRRR